MSVENNSTTNAKPVAKLQVGKVQAAIWARVTDKGTFFSATYKNGYKVNGVWKNGQSYELESNLALHHATAWANAKLIELRAADIADTVGETGDEIKEVAAG
jgi:hypothetical protein